MDEAKRFLRFIMPGALFGILTLCMLALLVPWWALQLASSLADRSNIGIAVAALIGSGALGFLFSAMHHQLVWSWRWWGMILHLDMARRLLRGHPAMLVVDRLGSDGAPVQLTDASLDEEMAQALVLSLWYQWLGCEPIKSGDARVIALTHTAHSAEIAAVSAVSASIVALATAACVGQFSIESRAILRFCGALVIGIGAMLLFVLNYRRVGRIANRVIETVLIKAIEKAGEAPLRLTIS